MFRLLLIYLGLFATLYLIVYLLKSKKARTESTSEIPASRERFRSKPGKGVWIQVYDTDSMEDARRVGLRLEEEDLDYIVYEQGRKDVHGNSMKGFGIAVSKSSVSRAQNIISRMPV